jgi:hypothetical protein
MSDAEYLRATQAQSAAYSSATDPIAVSATIITELNAYRAANGSPIVMNDVFGRCNPVPSQTTAKLG